MLQFEFDNQGELAIIVDDNGIDILNYYLDMLKKNKDTHFHLATPSWGGCDLTENLINKESEIINQIRIQKIKD
jgi:hypothetical protein